MSDLPPDNKKPRWSSRPKLRIYPPSMEEDIPPLKRHSKNSSRPELRIFAPPLEEGGFADSSLPSSRTDYTRPGYYIVDNPREASERWRRMIENATVEEKTAIRTLFIERALVNLRGIFAHLVGNDDAMEVLNTTLEVPHDFGKDMVTNRDIFTRAIKNAIHVFEQELAGKQVNWSFDPQQPEFRTYTDDYDRSTLRLFDADAPADERLRYAHAVLMEAADLVDDLSKHMQEDVPALNNSWQALVQIILLNQAIQDQRSLPPFEPPPIPPGRGA